MTKPSKEKTSSEFIPPEELFGQRASLILNSLVNIYHNLDSLGSTKGYSSKQTNKMGDNTLVGDLQSEQILIQNALSTKFDGTIIAEESPAVYGPANEMIVIDGFDGSSLGLKTPDYSVLPVDTDFGTIISYAPSSDPKFSEFYRYRRSPLSLSSNSLCCKRIRHLYL
jgi:fructose-1,6-bisphosphatase